MVLVACCTVQTNPYHFLDFIGIRLSFEDYFKDPANETAYLDGNAFLPKVPSRDIIPCRFDEPCLDTLRREIACHYLGGLGSGEVTASCVLCLVSCRQVNNEGLTKVPQYKTNMLTLNALVLVEATEDEIVYPYQSEQFGGYRWGEQVRFRCVRACVRVCV